LAVVLPSSHEEAANVVAACVLISLLMSTLVAIVVHLGGAWLIAQEFIADLKDWTWVVPILVLFTGLYQTCLYWLTRTQGFARYSVLQIALPAFTISAQVGLAVAGQTTAVGLIIGTLLGQAVVSALAIVLIARRDGLLALRAVRPGEILRTVLRYRAYPLYSTPYGLVGALRDRLVYFLLAQVGSRVEVGYYTMSNRMVNIPNSLASSAIRPVFFQKASRTELRLLEPAIDKGLRVLAVVVIPLWILFLFYAKELFVFVLGEPWRDAALYASILSIPAIPLLLGNWLDRSFDVLGRQRLSFVLELIFSLLSIAAIILGTLVYRKTYVAVCCQAGILTIYYVLWLVVLFHIAHYRMSRLLSLLAIIISLAVGCSCCAWALSLLKSWWVGAGVYGVLALAGMAFYISYAWSGIRSTSEASS
jgi:O-antigen/teichoic acid export membrane protein